MSRHPELSNLVGHWTFEDRVDQIVMEESGKGHRLQGVGGLDVDKIIVVSNEGE